MWRTLTSLVLAAVFAATANAQIVIDGMLDADYGSPIAVQTVETGFGDNFSEFNAVYGKIANGRLHILITGNLESNFNKMEIFFDSKAGGENTLSALPEYDFFDGGAGNWISQNMGGMTFDSGFEADYHMYARSGGDPFEVDFIDRLGGAGAAVNGNTGSAAYDGSISALGSIDPGNLANGSAVGNALASSILFAMNNTNAAGIGGNGGDAADQAAALAVTTGFEFSVALSELGADPQTGVKLAIMLNGSNHNFLSNQNFEGLPIGTGNLGGDGAGNFTGSLAGIDFNDFEGNQFITVGVSCTVDLIAGGGSPNSAIVVGNVTTDLNEDGTWTVTYATTGSWALAETHLHAGCSLEDFPLTRTGNPKVGQFDYKSDHDPLVQTFSYVVDAQDCDCVLFAAQAVVVNTEEYSEEGAWGAGQRFADSVPQNNNGRGNWATYFQCGSDCDP